jgi:hypothetical protein
LTKFHGAAVLLVVLLWAGLGNAKALHTQRAAATAALESASTLAAVKQAIPAFEATFTPYFQRRAGISIANLSGPVVVPTEADVFMIAKYWSFFSAAFKQSYALGMGIPPTWKMYVSPGGNFEIWYDTSRQEPVASIDTFGYDQSNWRSRVHGPNGVPDYIDQVAYAADSAWSMEITGFGFVKPWPLVDATHPSSRYKICIRALEEGLYAQTWPMTNESIPSGAMGYRTYIELRNEWNGAEFNKAPFDYGSHPEKAVGVTCCHEFFHGVQYAMTRNFTQDYPNENLFLEGFPSSWLEGTAVLMEGLGFAYVRDYLQYVDTFFSDPTAAAFVWTTANSDDLYKNSLATHYLYEFSYPSPKIDFVKSAFFNNYQQTISFKLDLDKSSSTAGRSWADILGSFFTGSYYSGPRAVAGRFIADAPLLDTMWSYPHDAPDASGNVTKSVNPFGMNTFSYVHQTGDNASMGLTFTGDTISGDPDTTAVWSVHCILKKDSVPAHDSIVSMPLVSKSAGSASILEWNGFTEALVVAVNARYDNARSATVGFQPCAVTIHKGQTDTFSTNPMGTSAVAPGATATVHAVTDLLCDIAITQTAPSQTQTQSALKDSLFRAGGLYKVTFPLSWLSGNSTMLLSVSDLHADILAVASAHHLPDTSLGLYRFDSTAGAWAIRASTVAPGDTSLVNRRCPLVSPGVYALFVRAFTFDSAAPCVAYPNPVRLSRDSRMAFRGANLVDVSIYGTDGMLLAHDVMGLNSQPQSILETTYGFDWRLRNASGAAVAPGVYFARIGFKGSGAQTTKRQTQKIFLIP